MNERNDSVDRAKALKQFVTAGKWEGVSYLLLLGIAMPLKHWAGMPLAVTIAGSAHGALFIWFMYTIFQAWIDKHLTFKQSLLAVLLSLLPFGTFRLHKLA